jgi:uncharacterized protein YaiI (UPF0178 family)
MSWWERLKIRLIYNSGGVVPQDYGVAAKALSKGAYVIH